MGRNKPSTQRVGEHPKNKDQFLQLWDAYSGTRVAQQAMCLVQAQAKERKNNGTSVEHQNGGGLHRLHCQLQQRNVEGRTWVIWDNHRMHIYRNMYLYWRICVNMYVCVNMYANIC